MKHLNKQKDGKKRLKTMGIGRVQIPTEKILRERGWKKCQSGLSVMDLLEEMERGGGDGSPKRCRRRIRHRTA
ncbi:hypothetical protein IE53DRAFT_370651 [Violaceomyces palustris]|uniref:Uncharacterized protein n=1 Tax=Violaceomyces palustris TaxID=1673888 RepID=A0ACD0NRG2_9BASI|nr:hypothetical protein IE53DRAFT_370651 [Violaceomyces palustris]